MFWKKKDKVNDLTIHPSLGKMKYLGVGWNLSEKVKMSLWSETYDVSVCFVADTIEDDVNEKQVASMEIFRNVITEQKHKMEEIIMHNFESDDEEISSVRFVPEKIYFSKKGECALFYKDADAEEYDDLGCGFSMFLLPKFLTYSPEDCLDYILGEASLFTEKELYGDLRQDEAYHR